MLAGVATSRPVTGLRRLTFRGSGHCWEQRYAKGGSSGPSPTAVRMCMERCPDEPALTDLRVDPPGHVDLMSSIHLYSRSGA